MEDFSPESDDDGSAPVTAHSQLDLQMKEQYTWTLQQVQDGDESVDVAHISRYGDAADLHPKGDWVVAKLEVQGGEPFDFLGESTSDEEKTMIARVSQCVGCKNVWFMVENDAIYLFKKSSLVQARGVEEDMWLINTRGIMAKMAKIEKTDT
eukprot:g17329.t1